MSYGPIDTALQDDPRYITALSRGLMILACFDRQHSQLSHQQICQMTQLPKATVSRLLFTLMATHYVIADPNGYYQLGIQALKLGHIAALQYDISNLSADLLKTFAETYQVSVNIAMHDAGQMRYVACYRSPARVSVNLQVGSTVPLVTTAIGRALYSGADEALRHSIQTYLQQQLSDTDYQQAINVLQAQRHCYQQQQFALSDGDFMTDILAIAVIIPVIQLQDESADFTTRYSLNVSVPRSLWQPQQLIDTVLTALQQLAIELAQRLSHTNH